MIKGMVRLYPVEIRLLSLGIFPHILTGTGQGQDFVWRTVEGVELSR